MLWFILLVVVVLFALGFTVWGGVVCVDFCLLVLLFKFAVVYGWLDFVWLPVGYLVALCYCLVSVVGFYLTCVCLDWFAFLFRLGF